MKKTCPYCNELIDENLTVCPVCYEALPCDEKKEEYHCPFCNEIIYKNSETCPVCCENLTKSGSRDMDEASVAEPVPSEPEYRCPLCREVIDKDSEICPICCERLKEQNPNSNDDKVKSMSPLEETLPEILPEENKSTKNDEVLSNTIEEGFTEVTTLAHEKQIDNYVNYMKDVDKKLPKIVNGIIIALTAILLITWVTMFLLHKAKHPKVYDAPQVEVQEKTPTSSNTSSPKNIKKTNQTTATQKKSGQSAKAPVKSNKNQVTKIQQKSTNTQTPKAPVPVNNQKNTDTSSSYHEIQNKHVPVKSDLEKSSDYFFD